MEIKIINQISDLLKQLLPQQRIMEFSFSELAGPQKMIDGVAPGTFTDMSGREITLKEKDFPAFVENTRKLIESTRTERGELVGLPIDVVDHDERDGAAGWVIDVEYDAVRKIIRFAINWTQAGIDLIQENVRRYFSPTLDPVRKVILGGSLTNWPATRDENWTYQLRPVELSEQIKEIDMSKTLEGISAEFTKLQSNVEEQLGKLVAIMEKLPGVEDPDDDDELDPEAKLKGKGRKNGKHEDPKSGVSKELQELLGTPEGIMELARVTELRVQNTVAIERRKSDVMEFAAKIVSGTAEQQYGAPVSAQEIVSVLLSLPEKQSLAVQNLLTRMWDQVVDFAERGFSGSNHLSGKPLPKNIAPLAETWVKAGKDIDEFMEVQKDVLGDKAQYNLAPYILKEKKGAAK